MPADSIRRNRILDCLGRFLQSTGRHDVRLSDSTHLTQHLGLKSDEGVDFVLDLCNEFDFELPESFNPFVHADGKRGLRVGEMVSAVLFHLPAQVKEAVL